MPDYASIAAWLQPYIVKITGTGLLNKYQFKGVFNDSRQVAPGTVFAAIRGAAVDGNKFIPQALKAGATMIVSAQAAENIPDNVIHVQVTDDYKAFAVLVEAMAGFPARRLRGFAITGTNGKTTSAMLYRLLLGHANTPCGMISTVEYDLGEGEIIPADRTTPEAARLSEMFQTMNRHRLKNFTMEVSSHALAQSRLGSLQFQSAIFTNLTGDHLDYHRTFDAYYAAKRRLFTEHLRPDGWAVINIDDPWGRKLTGEPGIAQVATFGVSPEAQWQIENIKLSSRGSEFTLSHNDRSYHVSTNAIGAYNISNIVGVLVSLEVTGTLAMSESIRLLKEYPLVVPGRLERIEISSGASAFVDYAHTDDALDNVLRTMKKLAPRRILTVFGAGGDRDISKRPRMGKVAAEYSDILFITSDNPRSESPEAIIRAIADGAGAHPDIRQIIDRRQAIAEVLQLSRPGDFILIAGKGHETYQEIAGKKYHFDDREILRELNELQKN